MKGIGAWLLNFADWGKADGVNIFCSVAYC